MTSLVHAEREGNILRLTLADNASRNSLSEAMMTALIDALAAARLDGTAVIVLAAEGAVFSAGHNLKEVAAHRSDPDKGLAYYTSLFARCAALMQAVVSHPCPIIAEVNGLASAAGCQLVASCDLAFASPNASFCTPGVNIGLFCSTPMVALSRAVPTKQAMEMLLTGDVFPAGHALRIGLINAIVAATDLSGTVMEKARHIAAKSQAAIRYGKRTFYEQAEMPLAEAYVHASAVMVRNMLDGAACEGIDAFIAKRKPVWPKTT